MKKRKFEFEPPKNTDELIEAIYEELCITPKAGNTKQVETLKDYVTELLAQSKYVERERKYAKDSESFSISFALGTFAVVSLVFLLSGWSDSRDFEWLNNHRFAVRLWGVAFAAVFIGVSIERSSLFKRLWSFGFTKVVASVAVSALLVFCTGKASSLINSVFGVDASVFPLTRAYLTGLLAFQFSSPLLIVVALFALFHAFDVVGYLKSKFKEDCLYDLPPWNSFAFLILAIVLLIFSWQWINRDFSAPALPRKTYRLAHLLDFNSRHSCINIKDGVSVVFVGSDHSKVLVDTSNVQTEDIESFVNRTISDNVEIPERFYFLPCQVEMKGK